LRKWLGRSVTTAVTTFPVNPCGFLSDHVVAQSPISLRGHDGTVTEQLLEGRQATTRLQPTASERVPELVNAGALEPARRRSHDDDEQVHRPTNRPCAQARRRRHDGFWLWETVYGPEPAEEPLPGTVKGTGIEVGIKARLRIRHRSEMPS